MAWPTFIPSLQRKGTSLGRMLISDDLNFFDNMIVAFDNDDQARRQNAVAAAHLHIRINVVDDRRVGPMDIAIEGDRGDSPLIGERHGVNPS